MLQFEHDKEQNYVFIVLNLEKKHQCSERS